MFVILVLVCLCRVDIMNLGVLNGKYQKGESLTDLELTTLYKVYKNLADNCGFLDSNFGFFKKELRLEVERLERYLTARNLI